MYAALEHLGPRYLTPVNQWKLNIVQDNLGDRRRSCLSNNNNNNNNNNHPRNRIPLVLDINDWILNRQSILWSINHWIVVPSAVIQKLCANGRVDDIKWLVTEGIKHYDFNVQDNNLQDAICNGHIEMVKWLLHSKETSPHPTSKISRHIEECRFSWILKSMAQYGRLEMLQWIKASIQYWIQLNVIDILNVALSYTQWEIVQWIETNYKDYIQPDVLKITIEYGISRQNLKKLHIWLDDHEQSITPVISAAVRGGYVDIFQETSWQSNARTWYRDAILYNQLEVIQYFHAQNNPQFDISPIWWWICMSVNPIPILNWCWSMDIFQRSIPWKEIIITNQDVLNIPLFHWLHDVVFPQQSDGGQELRAFSQKNHLTNNYTYIASHTFNEIPFLLMKCGIIIDINYGWIKSLQLSILQFLIQHNGKCSNEMWIGLFYHEAIQEMDNLRLAGHSIPSQIFTGNQFSIKIYQWFWKHYEIHPEYINYHKDVATLTWLHHRWPNLPKNKDLLKTAIMEFNIPIMRYILTKMYLYHVDVYNLFVNSSPDVKYWYFYHYLSKEKQQGDNVQRGSSGRGRARRNNQPKRVLWICR
jgi:hypothetical protein